MRINHNIASLNTYGRLSANTALQSKSLEKLSSGLRINRAGDDAAGLAISEKMRAQIKGLDQASRNAQDAISLIQTAEGALTETHSILQRMRELTVQASNDTNVTADRDEIQKEVNQLTSEINRIGNTTQFNTKNLLNGDVANTLTTWTTGNYGSAAGAAASAVTGLSGVSGVTFTGSGLSEYSSTTISIRRSGVDQTDYQGAAGEISGSSGQNIGASFGSNTINIGTTSGSGSGISLADSGFIVRYDHSAQTVTISGSGSGGQLDVTVALVSGKTNYDNMGVNFTFNASGLSGDGEITLIQDLFSSGSGAFGTYTKGYSGTNTGTNQWISGHDILIGTGSTSGNLSGMGDLPDENVDWTIVVSGASGANGFYISGDASGGNIYRDVVSVNLDGSGYDYKGYGLSFSFSGNGADDGDTFSFSTTPTYDYYLSVDSGAYSKIESGVSVAGLTGTYSGQGVKFSGTNVIPKTAGSGTSGSFAVYTSGSSGQDKSLAFQIGANQNQSLSLDISDMRAQALGISASGTGTGFSSTLNVNNGTVSNSTEYALDVTTVSGATAAITTINSAITTVSSQRSKLGAYQNRLEHTINNLGTSSENLTAAESRIRDVDMAKEMMEFSKMNILSQAATGMLAQANQQPQGVLQLLR